MIDGVTVTAVLSLKPEAVQGFVAGIQGMIEKAVHHRGFRSIRLLPSHNDPNQFIFIEEWDAAQDFTNYMVAHNAEGEVDDFVANSTVPPQIGMWNNDQVGGAAK